MKYIEKFKSKQQKWLEYSLVFAVIIILIGSFAFQGNDDEETDEKNKSSFLWWFIPLIIVVGYLFKGSNTPPLKTDGEIIKFVADSIYKEKGTYLNTSIDNVRVQQGAPSETYVEFTDKCMTYLYTDGVGVTERYPGETIKTIKKDKQDDKISMKLAEIGIARKKHLEKLETLGLTEEEQ